MVHVVLDTNALLLFAQGVDVFAALDEAMEEPYHLVVPEQVLDELQRLAARNGRDARAAKLGYVLVEQKRRENPQLLKINRGSAGYADDAIVTIAEDGVACTLDKELQRRLLDAGVRVLGLRQKQFKFL